MALRDQPYIPFYVNDYLTDEKLSCCTLSTQGVFVRIMCVLHKSETYGKILYKQIPKQSFSNIQYFAYIISKQIGVDLKDTTDSIEELLFFKVLNIINSDGVDSLVQRRMVKDFDISCKRSKSAKEGGGNPSLKTKNLFKQNIKQNPEYEYENEYVIENNKKGVSKKFLIPSIEEITAYCQERKNSVSPQKFFDFYQSKGWKIGKNQMKDWQACVRTWEKEDKATSKNEIIHNR